MPSAAPSSTACASRATRSRGPRSCRVGRVDSRRSATRCGSASPTTSRSMTNSDLTVDVVVDEVAVRRERARRRADRRDARDDADRVPQLRLVAVARRPGDRQAPLDREGRGRLGRLGRGLPRRRRPPARLDAVRAVRGSSRARRSCRPGRRRSDALLVTCAYLVERVDAVGDAVALPHRDRRGAREAARARSRRSRTAIREGESAYERFEVHRTVFPRDFLADFGFRTLRAQGRVELCRLELGGLQPVLEGKRARGAAEAARSVPAASRCRTASRSRRRRPVTLVTWRVRRRGRSARAGARRSASRSGRRPCGGCRRRP